MPHQRVRPNLLDINADIVKCPACAEYFEYEKIWKHYVYSKHHLTHGDLDLDGLSKVNAFDKSRISDAVGRPCGDVVSEQGPDDGFSDQEDAGPTRKDEIFPGAGMSNQGTRSDEFKASP
jgi:hypothetical protein